MDNLGINADHLRNMGDIIVEPNSKLSGIVYALVGSVLGFQCYNSALNFVPAPEKYASEKRFKWRNVMTSFAHALIAGSISIYCIVLCPELFNDLIHNTNFVAEALVVITCGYFIYDIYDLLSTGKLSSQWALVLHHIIVVVTFLIFLNNTFCVPCCVVALLVEVNSIFLHARQLIIMSGYDKSTVLFKAVNAVNIATYICLRFGVIVFFYCYMYQQRMVFSPFVLWTMSPILTVMAAINLILFWRLLKSDVLGSKKEPEILVSN